ncbi:MAG: peptide deformylase [Oscillospiraceae bacterium]|nr:peptide deformylase [Oscillospiraceae bacterium]
MIQAIVKDELFLQIPSKPATIEDLPTAQDLLDTLIANAQQCVGLAANMIGVTKRIIAIENEGRYMVMLNPQIIKKTDVFTAEEACLSLTGTRKTKRYKSIKISYQNTSLQPRIKTFKGFTAQIIQHEIDHCDGIII